MSDYPDKALLVEWRQGGHREGRWFATEAEAAEFADTLTLEHTQRWVERIPGTDFWGSFAPTYELPHATP